MISGFHVTKKAWRKFVFPEDSLVFSSFPYGFCAVPGLLNQVFMSIVRFSIFPHFAKFMSTISQRAPLSSLTRNRCTHRT